MATKTLPEKTSPAPNVEQPRTVRQGTWRDYLKPLASLKLTVALFAVSIFIVLVGTLAQAEMDMWEVMDVYFRSLIAWIPVRVFFPPAWFPDGTPLPGWLASLTFPFPGGFLIGAALFINLLAAHLVRFTIQARGVRLAWGIGTTLVGVLLTVLVILSGHNQEGLQGEPLLPWSTLWLLLKVGLAGLWIAAGVTLVLLKRGLIERIGLAAFLVAIGAILAFLVYQGDRFQLSESSLRILWQLIQGGLAAVVLLIGCVLIFKKRGGIVLLHAGIGLLMFYEFFVSFYAVEARMTIEEGQTVSYVRDIRTVELAVVDKSPEDYNRVTVVPRSRLTSNERLQDEQLPFDIEVVDYFKNSNIREVGEGDENRATAGTGLRFLAEEARAGSGADAGGEVDMAAAYVRLLDKQTSKPLGTYMLSVGLGEQDLAETVEVDGKRYDLALRFKREYKPYSMTLLDVRRDNYPGTNTPQNYSSELRLVDASRDVNRPVKIWMNNPLRYAGETFYQSGYQVGRGGTEITDLQVVTNTGWMIPYVSCMIVSVGLFAQFGLTLMRFLSRREQVPGPLLAGTADGVLVQAELAEESLEKQPAAQAEKPAPAGKTSSGKSTGGKSTGGKSTGGKGRSGKSRHLAKAEGAAAGKPGREGSGANTGKRGWSPATKIAIGAGGVMGLLCLAMVLSKARVDRVDRAEQLDFYSAGQLPVRYQGRIKPLDTLARNTLQIISNRREYFEDQERLFSVPAELAEPLNQQQLPDALRKGFEKADHALPSSATIAVLQPDERWEVQVGKKRYLARLEDNQIQVYDLDGERQPAIRWLLDVAADTEEAERHRVFRIDNFEVLEVLGLERRPGFRYAVEELRPKAEEFNEQVERARKKPTEQLSTFERKLLEVDRRIRAYTLLQASFRPLPFPPVPTEEEFQNNQQAAAQTAMEIRRLLEIMPEAERVLSSMQPPQAVPVLDAKESPEAWAPYGPAMNRAYVQRAILQKEANEPTVAFARILDTYREGDASAFNEAVSEYKGLISAKMPLGYESGKVRFESFFNHFTPFYQSMILYLVAFVLGIISWIFIGMGAVKWSRPLNWATFAVLLVALAVHTFALVGRIYISGRPPVTNLYSSAVFIGWGCVVLGLVLELVFRIGFINALSAVAGWATLLIAYYLSGDGDTVAVMQAVLDTQFWLATHVVTITLGYAATYFAGLFGIAFIALVIVVPTVLRLFKAKQPTLGEDLPKVLGKVIYGIICFALFLSFVGTVLGGLWADDSWGRFWGWDPKENGALIIVLWNALVLHARWGGMVKERGMAVLSIGGMIVTSWSWFGVNELGIGLHSYGFTEGVLRTLGLFVLAMLAVGAVGLIPRRFWSGPAGRTA